ncbi:MAG TPA: helix-turn-helix transcriptional regulator [Chloroflexi bacterium]|jgi:DNA-binding PadR family transcriptional regulator|nr:PadR family transcriptional regulator [Anaerolineaceae bacterium]HHX08143.1 helix-turn-helix transcriptional regulator [Chloroflexota bacterium]
MDELENTFENLTVEFRRGLTNLVVLSQCKQPTYGYELVKSLDEKGFPLDANTVYPLLRRLEKQNLLSSDWDTSTDKPRKYYQLSQAGALFLDRLINYWYETVQTVKVIIAEEA